MPTGHSRMIFFPLKTRKTQWKKLQFSLWTNHGGKIKSRERQGLENAGFQPSLKYEYEDSFFRRCYQGLLLEVGLSTQQRCFSPSLFHHHFTRAPASSAQEARTFTTQYLNWPPSSLPSPVWRGSYETVGHAQWLCILQADLQQQELPPALESCLHEAAPL